MNKLGPLHITDTNTLDPRGRPTEQTRTLCGVKLRPGNAVAGRYAGHATCKRCIRSIWRGLNRPG